MINNKAVKCAECNKFFKKEFGVCPFCGTEYVEDGFSEVEKENNEITFVGKCEKCGREAVLLRKSEIYDDYGKRNGNFCENCINKYTGSSNQNDKTFDGKNKSFFSRYSEVIILGVLIIIGIILITVVSNIERCSQCGKIITEGYTVFGESWCKECFF